jgi:CelD/BcsL family acetyltransferase involved in cellulose biosynthesis
MYVTRLTSCDQLQSLAGLWNELSGGIPFRTFQWLVTWWRHYGGAEDPGARLRLFVLAVYESPRQQQLVGIAPWFVEHGLVKGRVVRFLGSGEACSEYLSLLCRKGREFDVAVAVAEWLTAGGADQWDAVELEDVASDDAAILAFQTHMKDRGNPVNRFAGSRCWRATLPGTWDQYLSSLSKSHRRQVRRLERRLLNSERVRFRSVTNHDELHPAFENMVRLHRRRRAGLTQRSCLDSARFLAFLEDAAKQLSEHGMLHLNQLELDGRPVSADYNLVGNGVIYAYQGGMDPAALKDEPGNLLTIMTIRNAIREGYAAYDLLRGDEPYKAHWRAMPRESFGVRVIRRSHVAQVRNLAWLANHHTRQWAKSSWHAVTGRHFSAILSWFGWHVRTGVAKDAMGSKS